MVTILQTLIFSTVIGAPVDSIYDGGSKQGQYQASIFTCISKENGARLFLQDIRQCQYCDFGADWRQCELCCEHFPQRPGSELMVQCKRACQPVNLPGE